MHASSAYDLMRIVSSDQHSLRRDTLSDEKYVKIVSVAFTALICFPKDSGPYPWRFAGLLEGDCFLLSPRVQRTHALIQSKQFLDHYFARSLRL